jgi:hypothetical protein
MASNYSILGDHTQVKPGSPQLDGFHRNRVSLPFTTFDQAFEWDLAALFWDTATVDGGSIAYSPNNSSVTLTVDTGASDSAVRQSQYHHYRPGKSQLIPITFTFGAGVANLQRRAGYFDASDGIYLEQVGNEVALVRRTFVGGSPDDTDRVLQADWSEDTLSFGSSRNPSGISLNLAMGQLLIIDLQWLSEGTVRVGFDIDGDIIYVHHFHAANILVGPYMRTASLPIRYEITNLAAQGEAHTLRQGCSSVMSEDGDQDDFTISFSANTGTTRHATTTRRALISIRPKATFGPSSKVNRVPIIPQAFTALAATNDALLEFLYNPTFTGTPVWVDPGSDIAVEYSIHTDAAAGALTAPGLPVGNHYLPSGQGATAQAISVNPLLNKLRPRLEMGGAQRALTLAGTSMSGTSAIAAGLVWGEVR